MRDVSGGTWDYRQYRVRDLAEDVQHGRARWTDDPDADVLDFPHAREAVAALLRLAAELVHDLDWYFAGDTDIPDERQWLLVAEERVRATLKTYFDRTGWTV